MPISLKSNPRGLETKFDQQPRRRREIATKVDGEVLTVTRSKIDGDPKGTLMATTRTNIDDDPMNQKAMIENADDDPMNRKALPENRPMSQKVTIDKMEDNPMNLTTFPDDGQMNRKVTIDKTSVDPINSKVMISKTDDDPANLRDMINHINEYPMNQKAMINKAGDGQMNKTMTRIGNEDEGDVGQVKLVKRSRVGIDQNRTTRMQTKEDDADIAQGRKERMRLNGKIESIVPNLEPGQQKLKNKPIYLPRKSSPRKAASMKKEVPTVLFIFLTPMD